MYRQSTNLVFYPSLHRTSWHRNLTTVSYCRWIQYLTTNEGRKRIEALRYLWLSPRCNCYLQSFGILRSREWWFPSDLSAQPIGSVFKGWAAHKAWPFKMGQIGCHETSTRNYHSTLCKITKVDRSQSRCCKINYIPVLFSISWNFSVDSAQLIGFTPLGRLHPKNGSSKLFRNVGKYLGRQVDTA
jgi:hypothetical protein